MTADTEFAALRAEAQKRPRPVYLLLGEAVTTGAAAHALIDLMVPAASRDFNLEVYDGRMTSISTVLDSLRMRGLFPGTKVIWVRETTLLLSTDRKSDLTTALLEALEEERHDEAAGRLLTLLAMAGWAQEEFEGERLDSLSGSKLKDCFGVELLPEQVTTLGALQAYCRERELSIGVYRDDSELLLRFLEEDPPPGSVLILSTTTADGRKRLFKKLQKLGAMVDLRVARERSGALSREAVIAACRRIAGEFKLRIESRALELIAARAGADAPALAMEMEKLCLYVGDAKLITEADVRASFRDMAESWIFDFTGALAAGHAASAVPLLRDLLGQGDHPLRLLAMIAREVRSLLAARDCLEGPLAGQWRNNVSYAAFQSHLQPLLGELASEAFGSMHPFRIFKYLNDAAKIPRTRLECALIDIAELDRKFKSSRGDPTILLETFVRDLCQPPADKKRPRALSDGAR